MLGMLTRWRRDRAARPYARRLPRQLRAGWGASRTYTKGQIDAAIRQSGLDPRHAAIGYAVFLSPEELAVAPELLGRWTLSEAQAAFLRWRPNSVASAGSNALEYDGAGDVYAGYDSGSGHGGGHGGH